MDNVGGRVITLYGVYDYYWPLLRDGKFRICRDGLRPDTLFKCQNHLSWLGCSITIMATSLDLINQAPKASPDSYYFVAVDSPN